MGIVVYMNFFRIMIKRNDQAGVIYEVLILFTDIYENHVIITCFLREVQKSADTIYHLRISFTKPDSWNTNGTLGLPKKNHMKSPLDTSLYLFYYTDRIVLIRSFLLFSKKFPQSLLIDHSFIICFFLYFAYISIHLILYYLYIFLRSEFNKNRLICFI